MTSSVGLKPPICWIRCSCFKEAWKSHELHHAHVRRQAELAMSKEGANSGFSLSPKKVNIVGAMALHSSRASPDDDDD